MATVGLFKNIKDAKVRGDFVFESVGRYWMRIDRIIHETSRKKVEFIAIVKTVTATFPSDEVGVKHRVGDEVSHYLAISGSEYFDKDFKQFIMGALGISKEQMESSSAEEIEKTCEQVVANNGALVTGMTVEMHNRLMPTKKQTFFTKVTYVREVPAAEVFATLDPVLRARLYPDMYLEKAMAVANGAPAK